MMSEERKTLVKAEQATSQTRDGEERLIGLTWRVTLFGIIIGSLTVVRDIILYFQTDAWQVFLAAGGVLVAVLFMVWARALLRREQRVTAAYVIIIAAAISYGSGELAATGIGLAIAISGALLMLLLGMILLPRRWMNWLFIIGGFVVYIWLINRFEPLSRYDISGLRTVRGLVWGTMVLMAAAVLIQFFRTVRLRTLRAQLLAAFMLVAVLPVLAVNIVVGVRGYGVGEARLIENLETVTTLKETELQFWLQGLESYMNGEMGDSLDRLRILLNSESDSLRFEFTYDVQLYRFQQKVELARDFDELFLMNMEGRVILSSSIIREGSLHAEERYFQAASKGFYIHPPFYDVNLNRVIMVLSLPVVDEQGQLLGVFAGRVNLDYLNEVIQELPEGAQDYNVYLMRVDPQDPTDYVRVVPFETGQMLFDVEAKEIETAIQSREDGFSEYKNYAGERVVGVYHWLPELQCALFTEIGRATAFGGPSTTILTSVVVTLVSLVIAGVVAFVMTRRITAPLSDLTHEATRIASGQLGQITGIRRADEIGVLARAFNYMATRVQELIGNLEERVAERTRDVERRSHYLQAVTEMGHVVENVLEPELLVQSVVDLIKNAFELYYVGLFLLDDAEEWAVLHAGTGAAGESLLARGHRLRVNEGMVGWSVLNEQSRIAQSVEEDDEYIAQPELPDTRAAAAFPLRARGKITGVILVLADEEGVFDAGMLNVLQIISAQVAVALENARLYSQSQEAVEAARRAYGELVVDTWSERLRQRAELGYRYVRGFEKSALPSASEGAERGSHVVSVEDAWTPEMLQAFEEATTVKVDENGQTRLAIPIKLRDQVLGVLSLRSDLKSPLLPEHIVMVEDVASRLGWTLENARLLDVSRQQAAREQVTANIAARMREPLDVDTVLRTAALELREGLGLSKIRLRLLLPEEQAQQAEQ